jgi:hypothetical protein
MFRRVTLAVTVALAVGTGLALAQQEKQDMDAMTQEWLKWSTPGAPHATLAKLAGKWTTAQKMWMDPSAPPQEASGTAEFTMVHGGRYLAQSYTGTMMDAPFEGSGMVGYDNFGKRYMSTWADNMGTMLLWATGSANAAGNEITLSGSYDDPMTGGKPKKFREVMKITGADRYVFEFWEDRDGKMVRTIEIVHTRAK